MSRKQPGFPFGSLMPYQLDREGRPILLISTMAMHTQNLLADPRASLFVTEPDPNGDPLGSSRVTLIGSVLGIPEPELADARTVYLTGYPDSKYWVDFEDFFFYRMDVIDVYYVGGFGVMGWVAASGYSQAKSDPLAEHKKDIMQHMNADHKDALILLAKRFAGIEALQAEMTAVDRPGFHLRLKAQDGMKGARIAFLREVTNLLESVRFFVDPEEWTVETASIFEEFACWMYALQAFKVSSFNSAPSDFTGAIRKLALSRPTRNLPA